MVSLYDVLGVGGSLLIVTALCAGGRARLNLRPTLVFGLVKAYIASIPDNRKTVVWRS